MGLLDHMMANLYKPAKQEKPVQALPKHLTPAKAAAMTTQTSVTQGQLFRGEVLDLRANQIMVLLENGTTVSARTEGTLNLSIGQNAQFFVAQTTEDQILLKLAKEDTPAENPMIDKALSVANITKTERSVSIVTELLAHQQPVNEAGIRHYLSLSAKYPELPVKDLILMELHHIPVTTENVSRFVDYHNRNGKLLTQAQDMLQELTGNIEKLPEGSLKQELIQEFAKMTVSGELPEQMIPGKELPATDAIAESVQQAPNVTESVQQAPNVTEPETQTPPANITDTVNTTVPQAGNATASGAAAESTARTLIPERFSDSELKEITKDFLNSFLLKPEEVADPEKIQKYYEELNEKLTKLEQLSAKLAENTQETNTDAPKQMRSNLSFMETVNQVFPYIQLPLKFREAPAHGELYVYEKKRSLKPSDSLSALLHLELEALGTTDIFVTLTGTHVTTRFSLTDKESGELILSELPSLTEALAKKGYTLQSEVSVRESAEDEAAPTLLEQFLEEHAPGGLDRYTFDIRA